VLEPVASLSAMECVRETLRLALEELGSGLDKKERPNFWELRNRMFRWDPSQRPLGALL
jgi:hypothetical protein